MICKSWIEGTGDLETIGMICTGDLETIGMICKSYGWSVKRYR